MNQQIVSYSTIIKKTNLSRTVSDMQLKPHMDIEMIITNKYSYEFYAALAGDRAEYENVKDWSPEADYTFGDYVKYRGVIFLCVVPEASNVEDIMCHSGFKRADTYQSECLLMIDNYLKTWLSWEIAYKAAPFIRVEINGSGIDYQATNTRGKQAADQARYNSIMHGYNTKRAEYKKLLDKKMLMAYEKTECDILKLCGLAEINACAVTAETGSGSGYGVIYRRDDN